MLSSRAAAYYSTIAGRRCLLKISQDSDKPPVVLLGGTAQSIASWEPHVPVLSKDRSLLVYEGMGQGPEPGDLTDVSLPAQATQLEKTVTEAFFPNHNDDEMLPQQQQVNVVGFSLGARIAMAYATLYPSRIHKLHLTGVSTTAATPAGQVALESWKHLLKQNNLQGFAWSILQATYSPAFLQRNLHRLPQWIDFIESTNTADGLLELLEQTRQEGWSPHDMALKIKNSATVECQVVVGALDKMAPPPSDASSSSFLGGGSIHVMPNCGHAVPTEQARLWRNHVLDFLG